MNNIEVIADKHVARAGEFVRIYGDVVKLAGQPLYSSMGEVSRWFTLPVDAETVEAFNNEVFAQVYGGEYAIVDNTYYTTTRGIVHLTADEVEELHLSV